MQQQGRISRFGAVVMSVAVGVCSAIGHAQSTQPAANSQPAEAAGNKLEELIVTATRRTETNETVPISVEALSQDTMAKSGIKNITDVAGRTPGVEFDNSTGLGAGTVTNIAIRGIDSPVGASTTGIYIDETAVQGRLTNSSAFGSPYPVTFDLDRVEVVRGPQGTLFGAGAEGGAVRFIMSEPSLTTFSGRAVVDFAITKGGSPSYEAGVAAGGPMAQDTLGVRASVWHRTDGGFVNHVDPFTGAVTDWHENYTESNAARLALTVQPLESLKITPSIYLQRVMNHDTAAFYENLSNLRLGILDNGRLLRQPSNDSFYLASLKVEADLKFANFISITSYFDRHANTTNDLTSLLGVLGASVFLPLGNAGYGNPLGPAFPSRYADAAPQYGFITQRTFSEEVRLASSNPYARLAWVAGIYYSDSHQSDPNTLYSAVILPLPQYVLFQNNINRDKQTAIFGQTDLTIVSGLRLTTGVRVAHLTSNNVQQNLGLLSGGSATYSQTGSENPVTPKVGLSFQPDDRSLYYLSAAKGYRLGGANVPFGTQCSGASIPLSYTSDSVWSYEVGAKNRLFNDRAQIAASVFHVDWSHIQQNVLLASCGFQYIANTGQAVSNGFDLAAQMLLTQKLKATFALGYTDAHFTKNISSGGTPIVQNGDSVGALPQVGAPWIATLGVEYDFRLVQHPAYIRAENIFHSRNPGPFASQIPGGLSYEPDLIPNPSTNLLNLRASVSIQDYELALYVNNVLNSQPRLGRYVDITGSTLFTAATFRPITIGLNVALRF